MSTDSRDRDVASPAPAELAQSAEILVAVVEAAGDPIVVVDAAGVILVFNPAAERVFGLPAGEAVGRPLTTLMADGVRARLEAGLGRSLDTGEAGVVGRPVELVGVRAKGEEFPLELSLAAFEHRGKTLFGGIVRDLGQADRVSYPVLREARTEYAASQGELRASEEKMETSTASLAELRADYAISEEDLAGSREQVAAGALELTDSKNALALSKEELAVAVTHLARSREELEHRVVELAQSNAELEQFAYVTAHDLSGPLRTVTGFVQLLERRYRGQLDRDADRLIGHVVAGIEEMRRIIEDLLALARVDHDELRPEPVDCRELVDGILVLIGARIREAGAEVDVGELPTCVADPRMLRLVFRNLVSNAVKFTSASPRVEVSAAHDGEGWSFAVADNGIGIDPEHAERVFRMFQRLHAAEEYGGTGIGLALAKRVVERHGGRIWCESNPGGGTVFRFTIADHQEEGVR